MEYELFKIRLTDIINIMSKQILSEEFRRMQKLAGIGNNQILVEKNELANTLKSTIDNFDPNLSYKELAMAVADILREEYGKHLYKAFIKELQDKLSLDQVNEMNANDPVMMKLRAKKDTKPTTPIKPTTKAPNQNQSKIDQLLQQRADIIRDMEQEAEPAGGPIADEYADKLRMIDIALRKLKA